MRPFRFTALLLLAAAMLPVAGHSQSPPTAPAQPASSPDGTAMDEAALVEKWKAPPATGAASGLRTRGITRSATVPQIRTRSVSLSPAALQANDAAIKGLLPRGVKQLTGTEAARAQAEQDAAVAVAPQRPPAGSKSPEPPLTPPAAVIQVPVAPEKQVAFRLHFKLNSTEFADAAKGARQVATIAAAMKSLPETTCFLLEGHTCDLGENAHNQKLSESRALAVRTLLARYDVAPTRLLAAGFGESQCEAHNDSEEHRAQNRRVVIGPIELPVLP